MFNAVKLVVAVAVKPVNVVLLIFTYWVVVIAPLAESVPANTALPLLSIVEFTPSVIILPVVPLNLAIELLTALTGPVTLPKLDNTATWVAVIITPGVSGIVGLLCVVNVSTVTSVLLQCQYISIKSLAASVAINGVTAIKCAGIPALFLAGIVNTELLYGISTPFFLYQI